MDYFSATKKNEVLTHATKWMHFDNAEWKTSDIKGFIIPFSWNVQNQEIHRNKSRLTAAVGWEEMECDC